MLNKQDLLNIGLMLNRVTLKAEEAFPFCELVNKLKAEVKILDDSEKVTNQPIGS